MKKGTKHKIVTMKYSIIIPHYNRPDLIINTINSFKELKDKEIIIVDDLSTKENLDKLKDNVKKLNDSTITIKTTTKKLLLPGTRNVGIKKAKGKWIFFIDDDDEATPSFIKWLNSNKQKEKYDFYRFPNIERLNGKNKMFIFKWWHKNYSPQVSTYLFNKSFLLKNKLELNENVSYGEDIYFQMIINNVKIKKNKYIHHFSIYHNMYQNTESMMNSKKHNPKEHLKFIDDALNSNYLDNKSYCLTFLGIYYGSMLLKDKYIDKRLALKLFWESYLKINPSFKDFWKVNLPWKIQLLKFKKHCKKENLI